MQQLIIGLAPRECLTPVVENADVKKRLSALFRRTNVMQTSWNAAEVNGWSTVRTLLKDGSDGGFFLVKVKDYWLEDTVAIRCL